MSYPIKDKIKGQAIADSFNTEKTKLLTNNYENIITPLRAVKISDTVKAKIKDDMFEKKKAFENMPCTHTTKNELDLKTCQRCQFNIREIEAENIINSLTGTEETIDNSSGTPITRTLAKFTVDRGTLDDVRGYIWDWQ